ncbi:MAG: cytidine deaminase [Pelosinus sp.]|nr:cytidine deaminase [Pelosinus sp.]
MKEKLVEAAKAAREQAYAPYSHFSVGAAVLTDSQNIYRGCNIENASFGLTNCAERTAIFKAVSEGQKAIIALAIIADTEKPVFPCGACRQVMSEFCSGDTKIYLANLSGDVEEWKLKDLLPGAFTASVMDKAKGDA